jgi:hypothetical protein
MVKKSNVTKGKDSYDAELKTGLVAFFNKNVTPYPTDVGAPSFDLIPVQKQKDIMINHARMYAQQEYDRIMELVKVLQKQAANIKRRLDVTDMVHSAEYQFQIVMGHCYWLAWDTRKQKMLLVTLGPKDWATGAPENYDYQMCVKYMGDHTWLEVDDLGNPINE